MRTETEILVAGTGPVGLMAALAFERAGFAVVLAGPPVNAGDRRTTALMKPSLEFLDRLGVLDRLREHAAPLRTMRIVDATGRLIRSPTVTFRAAEIGEDAFGLNIPNRHLLAVLDEGEGGRAEQYPGEDVPHHGRLFQPGHDHAADQRREGDDCEAGQRFMALHGGNLT